ncbi:hypothetical protein GF373_06000, partial [bacterium]|nr:hypothetical protein [bacterium]
QVGDKMELTVLAPGRADGTVFVDIVKNNQTVLTHTVRLSESHRVNVPIDNALIGTLAINAYIVRSDGNMIRDTRQVVAVRADDLHIDITPNEEEYVPGQPASIKIAVNDPQGNPVQAALGMHIVDESVYSLTEKEPGLAKVFFAIEKELLKPKVEIHGFKMDKVVRLSTKKFKQDEKLSKALLSKVDAHSNFGLNINTANTKVQKAQQDLNTLQRNFFIQNFTITTEPRSVEEIVIRNAKDPQNLPLLDPWSNPYVVYAGENQRIFFASLGRDAQFETGDDIKQTSHRFILARRKLDRGQVVEREFEVLERRDRGRKNNLFFGETIRLGEPMRGEAKGAHAGRWREDNARASGVQARPVDEPQRQRFLFKAKPAPPPPPALPNLAGARGAAVAFDRAAGVRGPQAEAAGFGMGGGMGMEGKMADTDGDGLALNRPEQQQNWYYYSDSSGRNLGLELEPTSEKLSELDLDFSMPDLIKDREGTAEPLVVNGKINEKALEQTTLAYIDKKLRQDELRSSETRKDDVRVRRYFPETLFYTPELITDAKGEASVSLAMADSITTWRMSAMANAKSGAIGDATSAMKVFKPFFIDLDLPIALIQNDEVTIPVAIYNYLPSPQNLKIELEPSPWFKLLEGDLKREVQVAANEVTSVSYRIKATELGEHPITVYAFGSKDSDAIGRQIEVRPNGEAKFLTQNGHLKQPVEAKIEYPEGRIAGADKLFVKIYPGLFSQIVEGLDAILKMPHGCFEQTSSTTYPNVLALDYMRATERVTPAIEMKALEYINLGYQRLLTFEIDGGGFQVFGQPPATRVLTAYGLMEFSDMSRVYPIDNNVIEHAQRWLIGQMNQDGSWDPDKNYAHAEMWRTIQDNKVLSTAYIALGLAQSGLTQGLDKSKNYLFAHADEADDAYTLSILCNTLLALDPEHALTRQCMGRLIEMGTIEGDKMFWEAEASMSFARGKHAWVETTAWAALAMIESGRFPNELGKALNWIIEMKDPNGTWGTTHGTVLALKALVRSLQSRTETADAVVTIRVNDEEAAKVQITPENSDIFRSIDVTGYALDRNNEVEIDFQGEGNLLYQVVGKYFVPWDKRKLERKSPFAIDVKYDRTNLRRNDTVTCHMTAKNTSGMRAEMVMIDLGIPPGFRVEQPALDDYQKDNVIEKYTIMSRQLLIYLEYLEGNQEIKLEIPMKATLPIVAKAPESTIYEYYNPENKKVSQPQELIVE